MLLATDRAAYGRLSQLITRGRRQAEKGDCRLTQADVADFADGLLACVRLPEGSDEDAVDRALPRYRDAFGERCYLLGELFCGTDDRRRLQCLRHVSRRHGLPLVAANDVHYHDPSRQPLQDVLTAVRHGMHGRRAGASPFPNGERHLKSPGRNATAVC